MLTFSCHLSILGSKLTISNRKSQDFGLRLRSQYRNLRMLTLEEERTAGKVGHIGKKLKMIKKSLVAVLNREPTDAEWAEAARLDVKTLYQYLDLSTQARNRLVQHNLRLVDYWVTKILVQSSVAKEISYVDLMAEGVVGLTRAAESYNGSSRFGPYATVWVRSELYRGLTRLRPGNQASHRLMMIMYRMKKAESELKEKLNRAPSDEEIARHLHMRVEYLQAAKRTAEAKVISADTPVSESNEDNTYNDLFMTAEQVDTSTEVTYESFPPSNLL